jgi:hypothetical protein
MPTRSLVLALALALVPGTFACSGSPKPTVETGGAGSPSKGETPSSTVISAFAVSNENLNVDQVGMHDGAIRPDGNRDHAFTATIDGPIDALFLVETNQKGEPVYGYRADSMIGGETLPRELGGVIDTGKMTTGVGAVEGGKFVNADNGSVKLGPGHHVLTLYSPNTNLLAAGDFVRLYVTTPGGSLVAGPVAPY